MTIPPLDRLPFWFRCVLGIGVLVVTLLVLFLIEVAEGQPPAPEPLPITIYDDMMNDLDREALRKAYVRHVAHLYEQWMRDPINQPFRAQTGYRLGRKAFVDAMTAIDARK